jgi:DNA mismatch endonuclease (patch repair protein)
MRANRSTDTKPERELRSLLHRSGLRFRKDFAIKLDKLRVRPDIVFTRQRVAVFVDGCFWHRCPEHGRQPQANKLYWSTKLDRNVARDERVNAALSAAGWTVVRLWEHEAPADGVRVIESVVRGS